MAIEIVCTARLPRKADWIDISFNGEYVALKFQDGWDIFKAETGQQIATAIALDSIWCRVSNDGSLLVTIKGDKLMLAGAHGSYRVKSISPAGTADCDVCFVADSSLLWCAYPNEKDEGVLALIDSSSLTILDQILKPNPLLRNNPGWEEPFMVASPTGNVMAICQQGDDDEFLGIFFFQEQQGNILPIYRPIIEDEFLPSRGMGFCFSEDEHYFGRISRLDVWQLPSLQVYGHDYDVWEDEAFDEIVEMVDITFIKGRAILAIGTDNFCDLLAVLDLDKNSCQEQYRLPIPINKPVMKMNTLVGISAGGETLIYRLQYT